VRIGKSSSVRYGIRCGYEDAGKITTWGYFFNLSVLQSVADFASHLALGCLKKNTPADIPFQYVIRSIKILTRILMKCCQKDAIEAAGKFLGKIFAKDLSYPDYFHV